MRGSMAVMQERSGYVRTNAPYVCGALLCFSVFLFMGGNAHKCQPDDDSNLLRRRCLRPAIWSEQPTAQDIGQQGTNQETNHCGNILCLNDSVLTSAHQQISEEGSSLLRDSLSKERTQVRKTGEFRNEQAEQSQIHWLHDLLDHPLGPDR